MKQDTCWLIVGCPEQARTCISAHFKTCLQAKQVCHTSKAGQCLP